MRINGLEGRNVRHERLDVAGTVIHAELTNSGPYVLIEQPDGSLFRNLGVTDLIAEPVKQPADTAEPSDLYIRRLETLAHWLIAGTSSVADLDAVFDDMKPGETYSQRIDRFYAEEVAR